MQKWKKTVTTAAVCAVALGMLAVAVNGCARKSRNTITLAGSTAFQPFAEKLAEIYLATHKDVQINVQGGGSAVGIQAALSGSAEIGMADLLELPEEASALTSTIVARDGIAFIVHPQNPAGAFTAKMAHDVFTGRITSWKDAGGGGGAIRVISREEGSGTRRSFQKLVLGGDKLVASALFQNSNGTIREAVASDQNAVGYLSIGLVDRRVKALSYNGVAPTNANVKSGAYPLARPIYFLTRGQPQPAVKAFIDYVLSDAAQKLLEEEGMISAR